MIKIGSCIISDEHPSFIIAELSANHNQDFDIAIKSIDAAKASGADAIKLQTYTADTITIDCDNEYFQIKHGTLWDGTTLHKLYQQAYTPWEWQPKLKAYAESIGLICFSSPFDKSSVDFLEKMNVPAYKVASFEITDIPLIEYIASKKKPVIISTGIATILDINDAIDACKRMKNEQYALLKCTSSYPAPIENANLLTIPDMIQRYKCIVGLSDHTMGITTAITATALGSKIIEKHFILDRKIGGPDAEFSMEPAEFKLMVNSIRDAEKARGKVSYELTPEIENSRQFARSLFVVKKITAGEAFTEENIRSVRPGNGLHPKHYYGIIGKKSLADLEPGTPLTWEYIQK